MENEYKPPKIKELNVKREVTFIWTSNDPDIDKKYNFGIWINNICLTGKN